MSISHTNLSLSLTLTSLRIIIISLPHTDLSLSLPPSLLLFLYLFLSPELMASMAMLAWPCLHGHGQSSSKVFTKDSRKPALLDSQATPVYSMRSLYILAAFAGNRAPGWSSISPPRQQRQGAGLHIDMENVLELGTLMNREKRKKKH